MLPNLNYLTHRINFCTKILYHTFSIIATNLMTKIEEIIGPMIISSKIFDYATSFFIKKELTLRCGEFVTLK